MSDLKYRTKEELITRKVWTMKSVAKICTLLNGEKQKLKWIEYYLDKKIKEAIPMSMAEIEAALGHKVTIINEE